MALPIKHLSRQSPEFPCLLRGITEELWVAGDKSLLAEGVPRVAVVGSRDCSERLLDVASDVGRLAAETGHVLVSGDARGVDAAAQRGAARACGRVLSVLPFGLRRRVFLSEGLEEQAFTFVSHRHPLSDWYTPAAHRRNRILHRLGRLSLVVACETGHGGSWSGSVAAMGDGQQVLMWAGEGKSAGADALVEAGATPISDLAAFSERLRVVQELQKEE